MPLSSSSSGSSDEEQEAVEVEAAQPQVEGLLTTSDDGTALYERLLLPNTRLEGAEPVCLTAGSCVLIKCVHARALG